MRVGIDLISITGMDAGLQRYAQQLVTGLARFDKENEYTLFLHPGVYDLLAIDRENFENVKVRTPPKIHYFWAQAYLAFHCAFSTLDVLHAPVSALPYFSCSSLKLVITVHDLTFALYSGTMTAIARFYWKSFMEQSIRRARKIIAVSESTKTDLVQHYGLCEGIVKVIPECVSDARRLQEDELDAIRRKYGLPEKYLLYVGTLEPRKNLGTLIEAFHKAKTEAQLTHNLVIVGKKGWLYSKVFATVERFGLEDEVIFTGFASDEDLAGIYTLADVFVFPSLYEGFGLPPLEAMSYGVPVIASDTSSLPEVIGDAGVLVDPYNVEDLAEAICCVLRDTDLRQMLQERSLQRSHQFSVEQMIRETLRVYQMVVDEGQPSR